MRVFLSVFLVISMVFSPQMAAAQAHQEPSALEIDEQVDSTTPAEMPPESSSDVSSETPSEEILEPEYSGDANFFAPEHRKELYEKSKLSRTDAVLQNLLLPGLGNIYAEQYFYAGIAMSLMVFTISFVSYGLVTSQSEYLWFGAGTAAIAYAGSIATSIVGVDTYNEKLRQGLKVDLAGLDVPGSSAPVFMRSAQHASPFVPPPIKAAQFRFQF